MEQKPPIDNTTQAEGSAAGRELSHEETLAWINQHRAWRKAVKTAPVWARAIAREEIGKEFQTLDRAIQRAREGTWLCVGVADEPWFQSLDQIEAKYTRGTTESKQFPFDDKPHDYHQFQPKPNQVKWVACVEDPGIAGFSVRPGYDPHRPLHSPSGGYVVKGDVPNPYQDQPDDVWLVQRALFESTYMLLPEGSVSPPVSS